jgi:hypothetical protein
LHTDYLKAFDIELESRDVADWTDEEIAEFAEIAKEIDAEVEDDALRVRFKTIMQCTVLPVGSGTL